MTLSYTRLGAPHEQIRLLKFQSPTKASSTGSKSQGLCLSLKVVSLNDKPHFYALSYVWGDTTNTTAIEVDGSSVQVTTNLSNALRWLYEQKSEASIWADALCINQSDLGEKSRQIGLMSRIYCEAAAVICWMGPSTHRIEAYLRHQREPRRAWYEQWILYWLCKQAAWGKIMFGRLMPNVPWLQQQILDATNIIAGQTDFIQLEYSTRMWTFQEMLLPRDNAIFVLGGVVINHNPRKFEGVELPAFYHQSAMLLAVRDTSTLSALERQTLRVILEPGFALHLTVNVQVNNESLKFEADDNSFFGLTLGNLLIVSADRVCQDLRDKVFAVLGLLKEPPSWLLGLKEARTRFLRVEYTKPAELVIRDALYYTMHYESALYFVEIMTLYHPRGCGNTRYIGQEVSQRCFSSWLPDMTRRRKWSTLNTQHHEWDSGRFKKIEWWRRENPHQTSSGADGADELSFEVRRAGVVQYVLAFPATTVAIIDTAVLIIQEAYMMSQGTCKDAGSHICPQHIHCHELLSHLKPSEHNLCWRLGQFFLSGLTLHFPSVWETDGIPFWLELQKAAHMDNNVPEDQQHHMRFLPEAVAKRLHGMAVIILDDGHFGLSHASAKVGDTVALADAFRDVMLLRKNKILQERDIQQKDVEREYCLIDWPVIDGLYNWPNKDEEYVKEVTEQAYESIILI